MIINYMLKTGVEHHQDAQKIRLELNELHLKLGDEQHEPYARYAATFLRELLIENFKGENIESIEPESMARLIDEACHRGNDRLEKEIQMLLEVEVDSASPFGMH